MVLGRSFSGVGKKLVFTTELIQNPVILSDNQDISCALLDQNIIAACYSSCVIRIWSRNQSNTALQDMKTFDSYEVGIQMKLLGDNLYVLSKTGSIKVFSLRFSRLVKQIHQPHNTRIHVFDVDCGLLSAGLREGFNKNFKKLIEFFIEAISRNKKSSWKMSTFLRKIDLLSLIPFFQFLNIF